MSLSHLTLRLFRCSTYGKRHLHVTPSLCELWINDEKGGYGNKNKLPPIHQRLPDGFRQLKDEFKLYKKELYEDFLWLNTPLVIRPGEIDIVWKFGKESSLDDWITTSDSDHNEGFSKCELTLTKDGMGLFSGELNKTVPKDGKIARAGYCNMKTKTFRVCNQVDDFLYKIIIVYK